MIFCALPSMGQAPQNKKAIDKLKLLYEEGKILKVEFKCYNLSMHDEVKREPLLYLYWSMANYDISSDEQYDVEYPNALKDAIKYGVKFRKKDKKNEYTEAGSAHLETLHASVLEEAGALYGEGEYRKARSKFKICVKIDPNDHYSQFMLAYCELELKLVNDARINFEKGMKMQGAAEGLEELDQKERDRLKEEFLSYYEEKSAAANATGTGR